MWLIIRQKISLVRFLTKFDLHVISDIGLELLKLKFQLTIQVTITKEIKSALSAFVHF